MQAELGIGIDVDADADVNVDIEEWDNPEPEPEPGRDLDAVELSKERRGSWEKVKKDWVSSYFGHVNIFMKWTIIFIQTTFQFHSVL